MSWPFGLALTFLVACGDGVFTTKLASDLASTHHTASVLGVYRDGRMSGGGWDVLAHYVEPALGSTRCDVGYDSLVFSSSNAALASAIEEYTRADGPTDDLLFQLAPAAQGDLVLVLTFAGRVPGRNPSTGSVRTDAPGAGLRPPGGGPPGAQKAESTKDTNVLEISASLFSVALGHSVALVGMQYSGSSAEDALTRFGAKLRQSLPNLKCVGWNWNASIDPERIRSKINE